MQPPSVTEVVTVSPCPVPGGSRARLELIPPLLGALAGMVCGVETFLLLICCDLSLEPTPAAFPAAFPAAW